MLYFVSNTHKYLYFVKILCSLIKKEKLSLIYSCKQNDVKVFLLHFFKLEERKGTCCIRSAHVSEAGFVCDHHFAGMFVITF